MKKRVLSILLIITMAICLMPSVVMADQPASQENLQEEQPVVTTNDEATGEQVIIKASLKEQLKIDRSCPSNNIYTKKGSSGVKVGEKHPLPQCLC